MLAAEKTAAALLRRARRRREWSQAEFARRAGIPASQLCAYETAAKQPSAATLDRLLRVAGTGLGLADLDLERHRQARELREVLELVDVIPSRGTTRPGPAPLFRTLLP